MQFILKILRGDSLIRIGVWLLLSLVFGVFGLTLVTIISERCIYFFDVISYDSRRAIITGAQMLTLLLPAKLLTRLSPSYPTPPTVHLALSIAAMMFIESTNLFVFSITIIQVGLWAEVIGIFWKRNR